MNDLKTNTTAAAPTSGATDSSTEIESIRITRGKEDPTLSTDTSDEIEITEAAITCTSKSLYKSPLYQTMPMRAMQEKYRCKVEDFVWSKRYSEWCNKNSHDKKPMPRDYTFKEWVKLKKGDLDISKSFRKDLFRLWVIDKSTEALDLDEDPFERCLDEYNWVFPKEIEQLPDEYEIKIREKRQVLEEIWTKCKKVEERIRIGDSFEVTKYKFNNGYSFICVSGKSNETLSLGRKNGSRFRKMIMEEMKETLRDDGEDSVDET
ncbi:hypothetical protein Tco_1226674 [Tanacetum coccineum]